MKQPLRRDPDDGPATGGWTPELMTVLMPPILLVVLGLLPFCSRLDQFLNSACIGFGAMGLIAVERSRLAASRTTRRRLVIASWLFRILALAVGLVNGWILFGPSATHPR